MAVVYIENTIEIAVIAEVAGRPHVNVWHYRADEGVNTGDEDAVLDFANNWQDHMLDNLTAEYSLLRFEWRSLDPSDNNVGVLLPDPAKPVNGPGTGSSTQSVNTALLIHKTTANRPRGRRDGRCFLGGFSEQNVNPDGSLVAAMITAVNTSLQAFYDGVTDNPIGSDVNRHLVVPETTPASRAPGTQEVTIGARRVTSLSVDPKVASQRDRLR